MKEGIVALIAQWCILCLVWMGGMDRILRQLKLSAKGTLVWLLAFIVCTFAGWKLSILSVDIYLSGAILPLLAAGCIWRAVRPGSRAYVLAAAALCLALVFFVRKLLFLDPVLMLADERLMVPGLLLIVLHLLMRGAAGQVVTILLTVPLSDAIYAFSFHLYTSRLTIGGPAAQDLLWCSIILWTLSLAAVAAGRSWLISAAVSNTLRRSWKAKPPTQQ
ncbi:MAG: hypothetical protein H0Z34_04795 [Brevibacillus sp.]|nr:hypothetical protein [Brevibacillus sp.]